MSNGHDNRDSTGSDPDMSGRLERMLPPNRLPAGGGGSALGRALGGRAWIFLAVVAAVAVLVPGQPAKKRASRRQCLNINQRV